MADGPALGQVFYVISRMFHYAAAVILFLFVPKRGTTFGSWDWMVAMFVRHPEIVIMTIIISLLLIAAMIITVVRSFPRTKKGMACLLLIIATFSLLGMSMSYGWLGTLVAQSIPGYYNITDSMIKKA